ncbi:PRK06851 family protein [Halothermothrix orenii]|uniref:ATPase n=1 Tax=Halothermothrix orenii (strain H 168 / OCM 544 / DSM 9562) TaxID=373903 RepID=B8D024_HALOH|nr:PRK06851 family protein [Halothermothrix orenii]ACL70876.1 hypothetical protein Hore_21310 [Halothermothrix orenii H 168]
MEKGKITNFFPGGNTYKGFYSFYKYLPYKADSVFIIKGGPGTGKSTFMKRIGYEMIDKGFNVEFHWCSSDKKSLDGVVIPALKAAILDGTAPHIVDPVYPGAREEIIYLGEYWDSNYLKNHKKEITRLTNTITNLFNKTYLYLERAKSIYDELKNIYIDALDTGKANRLLDKVLKGIIKGPAGKPGPERHLFGNAITPQGSVSYLENITEGLKTRYIIKGKPGNGKSTLIKRAGQTIQQRGYFVLYLHNGFNPDSIDGVVIPDLNLAIINGNEPHNIEPASTDDELIDMAGCLIPETLAQYSTEIDEIKKEFSSTMNKAFKNLKKAKQNHDSLEQYYIEAMDFNKVEEKRQQIMKKILKG